MTRFKKRRPIRTKHDYLFIGLANCPECGNPLSGDFQKGIYYYRCTQAKKKDGSCDYTKNIRQDELNEQIAKTLSQIQIPDSILQWAFKYLKQAYQEENRTQLSKQQLIQKNIHQEKLKLERLTSKWLSETNADGSLISDIDYKESKVIIHDRITQFEEQLNDSNQEEKSWLTKYEIFFQKARNLKYQYQQASIMDKKIILNSLGVKFIRKSGKYILELDKPFSFLIKSFPAHTSVRTTKNPFLKKAKGDFEPEISTWLPKY